MLRNPFFPLPELTSTPGKFPNPSEMTITPMGMIPTVADEGHSVSKRQPPATKKRLPPTAMIPTPRGIVSPTRRVPIPPSTRRPDLFYKDHNGNVQPLPIDTSLYAQKEFYIGGIRGNHVFPLTNHVGQIVFQKKEHPYTLRVVSPQVCKSYHIPGTVRQVTAACKVWDNL